MANNPLIVLDGTGAKQNMSVTQDASGFLVGSTCVTDPTTGNKQAVGSFVSDNQAILGDIAALVGSVPLLNNGVTFDTARSNTDAQASLVSVAGQAFGTTVQSADLTNYNGRGVQIGIDITAYSLSGGTPTVVVEIDGKDIASGAYYNILTSTGLSATGFTQLTIYPGAPATSNVSTPQPLPRTWRVKVTIGGTAGTVSATVGASIIV